MSGPARLIGVGVGPGDPELMTLKALRVLREADVVAHFAKAGNPSKARAIAAAHLRPEVTEVALLYPVTTEIPRHEPAYCSEIAAFYDGCADALAVASRCAPLGRGDLRGRSACSTAPTCTCMCGSPRAIRPR